MPTERPTDQAPRCVEEKVSPKSREGPFLLAHSEIAMVTHHFLFFAPPASVISSLFYNCHWAGDFCCSPRVHHIESGNECNWRLLYEKCVAFLELISKQITQQRGNEQREGHKDWINFGRWTKWMCVCNVLDTQAKRDNITLNLIRLSDIIEIWVNAIVYCIK
jgi:hypothetical protein